MEDVIQNRISLTVVNRWWLSGQGGANERIGATVICWILCWWWDDCCVVVLVVETACLWGWPGQCLSVLVCSEVSLCPRKDINYKWSMQVVSMPHSAVAEKLVSKAGAQFCLVVCEWVAWGCAMMILLYLLPCISLYTYSPHNWHYCVTRVPNLPVA